MAKRHKYILKIGSGDSARYFYTQEEVNAYRSGKKVAGRVMTKGVSRDAVSSGGVRVEHRQIVGRRKVREGAQNMLTLTQYELHKSNQVKRAKKKVRRILKANEKKQMAMTGGARKTGRVITKKLRGGIWETEIRADGRLISKKKK